MKRDSLFDAFSRSARWYLKTLPERLLDLVFNVQSHGIVSVSELEAGDKISFPPGAIWYEATPWFALSRILKICAEDFSDHAFIDLGCGKGRILVEARTFPFSEIIGLEYSPSLCSAANLNLAHSRFLPRRTKSATVLCMDVDSFEFPSKPCVFYFYNSFGEQIMQRTADRLTRSLRDKERDVVVILFSAIKHVELFSTDSWRVVCERSLPMPFAEARKFAILRSRPSQAGEIDS